VALRLVERRLRVAVVGDGPLLDEVKREVERDRHIFRIHLSASEEEEKRWLVASSVYHLNMFPAEGFGIATLEVVAFETYPVVLRSKDSAAVEIVKALVYGAAVATPEEAATVISTDYIPEFPVTLLWQYHIAKVVYQYEHLIKSISDKTR
jgi:hypothetical protein